MTRSARHVVDRYDDGRALRVSDRLARDDRLELHRGQHLVHQVEIRWRKRLVDGQLLAAEVTPAAATAEHQPLDVAVRDLADGPQVRDAGLGLALHPLPYGSLGPVDGACKGARTSVRIDGLTETAGKAVWISAGGVFAVLEHVHECSLLGTKIPDRSQKYCDSYQ